MRRSRAAAWACGLVTAFSTVVVGAPLTAHAASPRITPAIATPLTPTDLGAGVQPVNAPAVVAGKLEVPVDTQEGAVNGIWVGGEVQTPTAPTGYGSDVFFPAAMNSNGLVVGYAVVSSAAQPIQDAPAYWDSANSTSYVVVSIAGLTVNGQPAFSAAYNSVAANGDAAGSITVASPKTTADYNGLLATATGGLPKTITVEGTYDGIANTSLVGISKGFVGIEPQDTTKAPYVANRTTNVTSETDLVRNVFFGDNGSVVGTTANGLSEVQAPDGSVHTLAVPKGFSDVQDVRGVNGSSVSVGSVESGPGGAVEWSATGTPTLLQSELAASSPWNLTETWGIDDRGDVDGVGALNGVDDGYVLPAVTANPPVVNSTGDSPAADPSSGSCDTGKTVLDSGGHSVEECTLRAAIQAENSGATQHTITFNLPSSTDATIQPATPLPAITASGITIDGTTGPNGLVALNCFSLPTGAAGFEIQGSDDTIKAAFVGNSLGPGILLNSRAGGDIVEGDYFGVTPSNSVENNTTDIEVRNSPDNIIGGTKPADRNYVAAATIGIEIDGATSTGNQVQGNQIGTTTDGATGIATGIGVLIRDGSHNQIGGVSSAPGVAPGNVIDGASGGSVTSNKNLNSGVDVVGIGSAATGNTVEGNLIGLDPTGAKVVTNPGYGVLVSGRALDTHVGASGGGRNVIAGAVIADVAAIGTSTSGTVIVNNRIGMASDGTTELPTSGSGGIDVEAASTTTIGLAGEGNEISGVKYGVSVVTVSARFEFTFGDKAVFPGTGTTSTKSLSTAISHNDIGTLDSGKSFSPEALDDGVVLAGNDDAVRHNVISGCLVGVGVVHPTGKETVDGDLIGVDSSGLRNLPDAVGILVAEAKKHTIVGTTALPNIIGNQGVIGISLTKTPDTTVDANRIGVTNTGGTFGTYAGTEPEEIADYLKADVHVGLTIDDSDNAVVESNTVGRQTIGVEIKNSSNVQFGAKLAGAKFDKVEDDGNLVVHNKTDGVELLGAEHPVMLSNRIYDNHMGIVHDGKTDGPSKPDVISARNVGGGHTAITFKTTAGGVLQVFRAASCGADPQPEKLLGSHALTTKTHRVEVDTQAVGSDIVATVTRHSEGTSLISSCEKVTTANDHG